MTEPLAKQSSQEEIKDNNNGQQEELDMGPWNFLKYVARKKKNTAGKGTKKGGEGIIPTETSARGITKA